ncbi:glycosyltransferase family 2 protein [Samsonia erythrinae]|uniref:Glycosyl transferase family 2 n=1 Tax=Samsonia erythrinae TaxID=160434 RepID=A0A4V2VTV4_9GAMM|nr:glycosyltransferase [Samsonia erythrinae]TCV08958.1 glycosyl transferase family 2 [Samsonia erythrinae]
MKIEVLISTMNEGLKNINLVNYWDYLIIHQVTDNKNVEYQLFYESVLASTNVRYIQMDAVGLSISRNKALENSVGDFLWIMDDDVIIHDDAFKRICELIEKNCNYDVFVLNHSDDVNIKKTNKKYREHNMFSSASISSIDILMNRKLVESGIRFDRRFGLGTTLPSGEEYIFITDALKKNFCVLQTDLVVSYHPPFSSGLDFFSSENKIAAKVEMFKRIFGFKGRLLAIAFFIKKFPKYAFSGSFNRVFKVVLKRALFRYP